MQRLPQSIGYPITRDTSNRRWHRLGTGTGLRRWRRSRSARSTWATNKSTTLPPLIRSERVAPSLTVGAHTSRPGACFARLPDQLADASEHSPDLVPLTQQGLVLLNKPKVFSLHRVRTANLRLELLDLLSHRGKTAVEFIQALDSLLPIAEETLPSFDPTGDGTLIDGHGTHLLGFKRPLPPPCLCGEPRTDQYRDYDDDRNQKQ